MYFYTAATFVLIDIYIKGVPKLTQGLGIKYKINVRLSARSNCSFFSIANNLMAANLNLEFYFYTAAMFALIDIYKGCPEINARFELNIKESF